MNGALFHTIGRRTNSLTRTPQPQANAYEMIGRRDNIGGLFLAQGQHCPLLSRKTFSRSRASHITPYRPCLTRQTGPA